VVAASRSLPKMPRNAGIWKPLAPDLGGHGKMAGHRASFEASRPCMPQSGGRGGIPDQRLSAK